MSENHASWEKILDAIESPETCDPAIRSHLQRCRRCARFADKARRILGLLADARLHQPPRALLEGTIARVQAELLEQAGAMEPERSGQRPQDTAPRPTGKIAEIWAALVADSLQPSPSLRGVAWASPRMLLYETDAFSVTVSVTSDQTGEYWNLLGQVAPKEGSSLPPGGRAVAGTGAEAVEAPLTQFGEFSLHRLTPAVEEVSILIGESCIRLRLPPRNP